MRTMPERPHMLVPFDGSPAAERLLRAACQASLRDYAPLVVLCMVPIPAGRAADETPPNAAVGVMRAMVRAQDICRREGIIAFFRETFATDLAAEILRVAEEMHATVIAMSLDEWAGEGTATHLMSPTVQRVLAGAQCTVLIKADSGAPEPARIREEERLETHG